MQYFISTLTKSDICLGPFLLLAILNVVEREGRQGCGGRILSLAKHLSIWFKTRRFEVLLANIDILKFSYISYHSKVCKTKNGSLKIYRI